MCETAQDLCSNCTRRSMSNALRFASYVPLRSWQDGNTGGNDGLQRERLLRRVQALIAVSTCAIILFLVWSPSLMIVARTGVTDFATSTGESAIIIVLSSRRPPHTKSWG